jgi:hypothetical protein
MSNPSILRPPALSPHADPWSEVRANGRVMRYRRSGVGRPVVVLRPHDLDDGVWPALLDRLGARHRLFVPELPPRGADITSWLAAFLDGLGVSDVAVVAAGCFCLPALELALRGVDRVARLALMLDGPADGECDGLDATLVTTACPPRIPLLVIRHDAAAQDAAVLDRFLAGAAAAATA